MKRVEENNTSSIKIRPASAEARANWMSASLFNGRRSKNSTSFLLRDVRNKRAKEETSYPSSQTNQHCFHALVGLTCVHLWILPVRLLAALAHFSFGRLREEAGSAFPSAFEQSLFLCYYRWSPWPELPLQTRCQSFERVVANT